MSTYLHTASAYAIQFESDGSRYVVLEKSKTVVKCGPDILKIMESLGVVQSKNPIKCEGSAYTLGDFLIRVGTLYNGPTPKSKRIVIEVEYKPCFDAHAGDEIIRELIQTVLPSATPTTRKKSKSKTTAKPEPVAPILVTIDPVDYKEYSLPDTYSLSHSALEFVQVIKNEI